MKLTLARLLGEERTFYGYDSYGRAEDLYTVKPGRLQIVLAGLLLGKNAALATKVSPEVKPKPFVPVYGIRYVNREHIDNDVLKLQIERACGYTLYNPPASNFASRVTKNITYRFARRRAALVNAILGLS